MGKCRFYPQITQISADCFVEDVRSHGCVRYFLECGGDDTAFRDSECSQCSMSNLGT